MNDSIYKFSIPEPGTPIRIRMSKDAQVLRVSSQGNNIVFWAEVDSRAMDALDRGEYDTTKDYTFVAIPTGRGGLGDFIGPDGNAWRYWEGTAQLDNGLVFHVYQVESA